MYCTHACAVTGKNGEDNAGVEPDDTFEHYLEYDQPGVFESDTLIRHLVCSWSMPQRRHPQNSISGAGLRSVYRYRIPPQNRAQHKFTHIGPELTIKVSIYWNQSTIPQRRFVRGCRTLRCRRWEESMSGTEARDTSAINGIMIALVCGRGHI